MKSVLFCALAVCFSLTMSGQQTDVNRYTIFTGFDYAISPSRNLTERGFDIDFGVTVRRWLSLGADFSAVGADIVSGAGTINGSDTSFAPLLNASAPLGAPPAGAVRVPFTATTYSFAAGPQFSFRRWRRVTLFARPGFGIVHESARVNFSPQIGDLFSRAALAPPASHQSDTTWFIGLGGGFDLNISRRVGLRFAADWGNTHLFSNLLTNRQNYLRLSVGPTFRWGHLK